MSTSATLEDVARQAVDGDRDALDRLVSALQDDVYGLALRMLWNREDAEDATQEILVRVVTRLAQFDFRSRLKTWVYRVAVNYMLDVKKSPVERMQLDLSAVRRRPGRRSVSDGPADAERSLLTEEVKIGCTLGMLQCLDRPHRLAYVLGEILELPGPEAAEALGIAPARFRKRFSTHATLSCRLREATVGWFLTLRFAPATVAYPRLSALDEFVRTRSTMLAMPLPSRKPRRSYTRWRERGASCHFIDPANLVNRRSTSRAGLFK